MGRTTKILTVSLPPGSCRDLKHMGITLQPHKRDERTPYFFFAVNVPLGWRKTTSTTAPPASVLNSTL